MRLIHTAAVVASLLVLASRTRESFGATDNAGSPDDAAIPATESDLNGPAPFLRTSRPRRRTFVVSVPWVGHVESRRDVSVVALESGRVETLDADDERPARKGDLLMTLGGPEIEGPRALLRDKTARLKEQLVVAVDVMQNKRQALRQKLATRDDVDAARLSLLKVKTDLDATTRSLQTLEEQTRVRVPIDGAYTGRVVNVGQTVQQGQVLARIVDPTDLVVVARLVPASRPPFEGMIAIVTGDDGTTFTAAATRVLPTSTALGEARVWIAGPEIDRRLRPGQGVRGILVLATRENGLAVPTSALVVDEQENTYVYVKEAGAFLRHRVSTGATSGDWVEITSGLSAGDDVVTEGAYELQHRDFYKAHPVED